MTGTHPSPTITRRVLLLAGAGAAATAAIPQAAKGASKAWAGKFASHKLRSNWEPLVGSELKVGTGWGPGVRSRLIAVEDIPNLSKQTADFRERSFVLVFQGGPLAAATYSFSHKRLGKCSLAITSGDADTYSIVMANAKLRRKPKRLKKPKKNRAAREDRRKAKKKRSAAPKAPAPEPKAAPEKAAPAPEPKAAPDATTFESAN